MKKLFFVQSVAKQYRLPFFNALHKRLLENGIELNVIYSDPNDWEAKRGDNIELPEYYGKKVRAHWLLKNRLIFQHLPASMWGADLIVVDQANKYIMNYPLMLASKAGLITLAYWGHGKNRQSNGRGFSEALKKHLMHGVDWWFAYTKGVANYIKQSGYPEDKITSVQNSVDVEEFRSSVESVEKARLETVRNELRIPAHARIALYCGGLHPDKRLTDLVAACDLIKASMPEFHMIIAGAGISQSTIEEAAQNRPWLHYTGPAFGSHKAELFKLSEVFLCPGLVGLAILDAFAAGIPLITMDLPIHSPEVDYLTNKVNGIITNPDINTYAQAVIEVFNNKHQLDKLKSEALHSSHAYSIDNMAENFAQGVIKCLSQ